MWSVSPPPVGVMEAAHACVQGIRNKDLAERVRRSQGEFESNNAALRHAASNHELHTVTSTNYVVSGLDDAELKKLYTQQLAKAGRPGRAVYSAIMGRARHGRCSYCQYGVAHTLDHFVPKNGVPALSIDPWNLVPCCRDCNSTLLEHYEADEARQFFHPYEMPLLGRWLIARVNHSQPVSATFYVDPDAELPGPIRTRLEHEFDMLKLNRLYAVVSAQDITETTRSLVTHFSNATAEQVRSHLQDLADTCFAYDENSRRAVLLEALAEDDWYCGTGFLG